MKYLLFEAPSWCQPCKAFAPVIDKLSQQIPIEKVDIDLNRERAVLYSIRSVPTLVLIGDDGREITRLGGVQPAERVISVYNQHKK